MATRAKEWPQNGQAWPAANSNAATDRNDAAMLAARVSYLARRGLKQAYRGQLSQTEILYLLAEIDGAGGDICRLMERHGAPTRPIVGNE